MNFLKLFGVLVQLFLISNTSVRCANILGLYTFDIKSHYILVQNVFKELAKSGHNVTVFTPFKTKNLPENYREVTVKLSSLDGKSSF